MKKILLLLSLGAEAHQILGMEKTKPGEMAPSESIPPSILPTRHAVIVSAAQSVSTPTSTVPAIAQQKAGFFSFFRSSNPAPISQPKSDTAAAAIQQPKAPTPASPITAAAPKPADSPTLTSAKTEHQLMETLHAKLEAAEKQVAQIEARNKSVIEGAEVILRKILEAAAVQDTQLEIEKMEAQLKKSEQELAEFAKSVETLVQQAEAASGADKGSFVGKMFSYTKTLKDKEAEVNTIKIVLKVAQIYLEKAKKQEAEVTSLRKLLEETLGTSQALQAQLEATEKEKKMVESELAAANLRNVGLVMVESELVARNIGLVEEIQVLQAELQ